MLLADTAAIDVGGEWYPFETWEMLAGNAVLFALCFAALLVFDCAQTRFAIPARSSS